MAVGGGPTYKQLQFCVSHALGVRPASVKTCWIAEVKRSLGLAGKRAPNAGQGNGAPPCPPRYRVAIKHCVRNAILNAGETTIEKSDPKKIH